MTSTTLEVRTSRLSRLPAVLRAAAWLGFTLMLLVAGAIHWSDHPRAHFADTQVACAVGSALLAVLVVAYTLGGRTRSAALALILSLAASAGWVALLFL